MLSQVVVFRRLSNFVLFTTEITEIIDFRLADKLASAHQSFIGHTMNKTELIEAIAERSQTSKAQTTVMLNGLLEILQEAMANGKDVQLVGFGTFSVSERATREGRNPATGEAMIIPAKKVVKFKPGKALSDAAAGVK